MTPAQCRAARALIDMTQAELAGHAVVPTSLIADYATGANVPRQVGLDAIQKAQERAGVEFIDGDMAGSEATQGRPVRCGPSCRCSPLTGFGAGANDGAACERGSESAIFSTG